MRLILVRHGETDWNKEKRYQGSIDRKLSFEGRKNIGRIASEIKSFKIDFVYTSALTRARQSGRILAVKIGVKPRMDKRLNELNFGRWEGKTAAELLAEKDKSFLAWSRGKWTTPKGGESLQSLRRRVRDFLKDGLKKHFGKTVLIVSHGGPIRMMIRESLGLPEEFLFSFSVLPASLSAIQFFDGKSAQLVCLNAFALKKE